MVVEDSRVEMRLSAEESAENNSSSVRLIRTRAEDRAEERSDFAEESSVKFTMETNHP